MAIIETEATLHEAHRDNHTHRDVNGGWLRPAVFGAMDGLVSNLALMTGVAGGAVSQQTIVLSGLAGPGRRRLLHGRRRVHLRRLAARARRGRAGRGAPGAEKAPEGRGGRARRALRGAGGRARLAREVASPAAVEGSRAGAGDTRPRGAGHRPRRSALAHRGRGVESSAPSRWARCCPSCRICSARAPCGPPCCSALLGLFLCGAVVAKVTARTWWYSGLRQLVLGGAAAGVTYALGSLFGTAVG